MSVSILKRIRSHYFQEFLENEYVKIRVNIMIKNNVKIRESGFTFIPDKKRKRCHSIKLELPLKTHFKAVKRRTLGSRADKEMS